MTTPKQILTAARELIRTEERWIQGEYARRVGRHWCFCLTGALVQSASELSPPPMAYFLATAHLRDTLAANGYTRNILSFNDRVTYKEMRRVLDNAIETAPDISGAAPSVT